MPTATRLPLEQLISPIAGSNPAGDSRAYAHRLREKLQELRREDDPTAYDDATRPASLKHADWDGVLELAEQALSAESKDLRVVCHRAEAMVHLEGFSGLRESLELIRRLSEEGWDRLNPPLEADDPDSRAAHYANMLDDPDRGLCFPNLVRHLPLIGEGDSALSYSQWKQLRSSGDPEAVARCTQLLHESHPAQIDATFRLTAACIEELKTLRAVLDDKLGNHAPGFTHLEDALDDCYRLVGLALTEVGGAVPEAEADTPLANEANDTAIASPAGTSRASARNVLNCRREAYQQIEQAAHFLCQIEPHSPVPYLVKRAVEMSKLPFPQLIRQLVREEGILSEMYRELGIDTAASESSDVS